MRLIVDFPFAGNGIEEHQVFFEGARLGRNFAVGSERHAGAIKDQAVIASNLVHVHDGAAMMHGDGAQHLKAQASFVDGVGRSGNIQKDGSSLRDNFGYRVAIITAISPEIFIVPHVFADGDAQLLAVRVQRRIACQRAENIAIHRRHRR